jgi:hypothetical protein
MSSTRCSARPKDLIDYAREADDIVWQLRSELQNFDDDFAAYLLVTSGFFRMVGHSDPLWRAAFDLEDLSQWVGRVGWAFATAGGESDASTPTIVQAESAVVDRWLEPIDWQPAQHLQASKPGDWFRAVDPTCRVFDDGAGYRGSGFMTGPDGRRYPLVAPYVIRDGTQYDADDGVEPGAPSVLELDGRDTGWTTIYEAVGIERWRDAPDVGERILIGIGTTAAGPLNGSSKDDVEQLTLQSGRAPTFGAPPTRVSEPSPPAYIAPSAPEFAPPRQPDTMYPGGKPSSAAGDAVSTVIYGVGGAVLADLGSHAGYDVMFQQNADGRTRALYKRVYVGFDENGEPYADSVWVTGPETNDHVVINYAP